MYYEPTLGLLAQELTSTGVAGWSSFGLTGLILGWLLLKHLPEKDRLIAAMIAESRKEIAFKDSQVERMLAAKNEQIKVLTESGTVQLKALVESNGIQARLMHEENQKSLDRIIKHCEAEVRQLTEENNRNGEILQHDLEQLTSAVDELSSVIRELAPLPYGSKVLRQKKRPYPRLPPDQQPGQPQPPKES